MSNRRRASLGDNGDVAGSASFSDRTLAKRLERTEATGCARFVETRARLDPLRGAEWKDFAGCYAIFDGIASAVTQTFGLGMFEEVTDIILDEIEAFFQNRGAEVFHEVCPFSGPALAERLCKRGYRPVEVSNVLYRPLDGPVETEDSRVRARRTRNDEADLWGEVTAQGWSDTPGVVDYLREVGPALTAAHVTFLAELEGRAIASGVLVIHEGVALLAGACTIPEAGHQGAQLALLNTRLSYAAEQGCDVAMVCTEVGTGSQRNSERNGFRIAYTHTKWGLALPKDGPRR